MLPDKSYLASASCADNLPKKGSAYLLSGQANMCEDNRYLCVVATGWMVIRC